MQIYGHVDDVFLHVDDDVFVHVDDDVVTRGAPFTITGSGFDGVLRP